MASPWLSRFRQGSFRGIQFQTDSHTFSRGRHKVDHEFPQREQNRAEDLGRRTGRFSLEMFVIGEVSDTSNYFDLRDALADALDQKGPGELVHPYLGKKLVQVGAYSFTETVTEGNVARFTVEFSEAGQALFPDSGADELANSLTGADTVLDNSKTAFENLFSIANSPAHVVEQASAEITAIADFMTDAVNKFTQPIAELTFAISNFKADVNNLLNTPDKLADAIKDTFEALFNEFEGDEKTASNILGDFTSFGDDFEPIVGSSPSNQRQILNQTATKNIAKEMAFANQAKTTANSDFISVNEATQARDRVIGNLDLQLDTATDDDLFQAIKDLQASLSKALPSEALRDLIEFTPPITLPALVIVYRLFGKLDKEQELIDQNSIQHPAFVPGGQVVEVSSDG